MNEKAKAFIRLGVMMLLVINGFLSVAGKSPISNDEAYKYVSEVIAIMSSAWTWWKNNNVTKSAEKAQQILDDSKRKVK